MVERAWIGLALLFAVAGAGPCLANDVEHGRRLAERLCATCHMNEGQGEKTGPMGVPSFQAIADRRSLDHARIVEWLRSKPPMMPDHKVTWDEADALAAFILSLRRKVAE